MPQRNVVEEEQRFGALGQNIVDAHRHGVDAYGVVLVQGEGYLELGAHSVGSAHQYRLLDVEGGEVEHAAERADIAHRTLAGCRGNVLLDAAYYFVTGLEVYTGLFV